MTSTRSLLAAQPAARPAPGSPLAAWLLNVAQSRSGPHAGAVAGCVSISGAPSYVYPEIAGYYLSWLAWRARQDGPTPALAEHAASAQRWLERWLAMPGPPTRVHLDGTCEDWRNHARFTFDIAMVLRGLGAATAANLVSPDASVVAGLSRELTRLVAEDGAFVACAADAGTTLPDRWSTRRGPYLAKAAGGILRAATQLPGIAPALTRAAEKTFVTSVAALVREPHRESHPLLYAFEAVLNLPKHPRFHDTLPVVAAQFDILLAQAGNDGHLPEMLGAVSGRGPSRVDVIAQAVRVGHLLAAHRPQCPPDRVALARLRQMLSRQVRTHGGVAFARSVAPAQANVWATMFADQALAFVTPARDADAWWRTDPLVI
jgi:hypothetical protein